jgi:serine protease Do
MTLNPRKPSVEALSSAGARMVEAAQESVVQVQSGGRGAGAGVILSPDGLVMTNQHVVAGRSRRGGNLRATLRDGRSFGTRVTKRGRGLDLALLRLEGGPGDLPAVRFGDSDALRVGELVYAIGHPWGRLGAATSGIVSELGVTGRHGRGHATRYIQSDVSLAPGNSGGPLLNARGEVIGINAMIFGSLALSIPSNATSAWAASEEEPRPRLGVAIRPVELREDDAGIGLLIVGVREGRPAARAGLLVGDVLLGDAAGPFEDAGSLLEAVARAGDAVRLRVMRGGNTTCVDVPLGASGPGRAA